MTTTTTPATRKQRLYRTLHAQLSSPDDLLPQALRTTHRLLSLDPDDQLAQRTHAQLLLALDRFKDAVETRAARDDAVLRAYALYKLARHQTALEVLNGDLEDEHEHGEENRAKDVLLAQLYYRLGSFAEAQDAFDELIATADPDSPELPDLQGNSTTSTSHLSFLSSVPSLLPSLSVPSIEDLESRPLSFLQSFSTSSVRKPVASTSTLPAPAPKEKEKKRSSSRPLPPRALLPTAASTLPAEDRWIPKRQRPSMRDQLMQQKEKLRGRKRDKVQAGLMLTQGAAGDEGGAGGGGGKAPQGAPGKKAGGGGGGGKKKKGRK